VYRTADDTYSDWEERERHGGDDAGPPYWATASEHGIWSKQVEFNNQIIVFTRTKTFWFGSVQDLDYDFSTEKTDQGSCGRLGAGPEVALG